MTKIAYNACFGGFSLSKQATMRYAEKKGITLHMKSGRFEHYYTSPTYSDNSYFDPCNISRTDPSLIEVIEELGAEANGSFAKLAIAELSEGTKYRIDEYDGNETVMTIDDYEWEIA